MSDVYCDPTVKHDAVMYFDAIDSNPNGDPDNGGRPRVDLGTGQAIVSDVSLKRKVRDSVQFQVEQGLLSNSERYGIFIRRGVSLNEQLEGTYKKLGQKVPADGKNPASDVAAAQKSLIDSFYDVRMFGAVMSTGKASAGKVTGPITVGIGRSLHPVDTPDLAITRTASTKEDDRDNASQMGSKTVLPYALFRVQVHYQPTKNNHVTSEDLQVFWNTLTTMFEVTRSAARPDINVRSLSVFSHDSALGNAPARALLDRIVVEKTTADSTYPTSFADYTITPPSSDDLPPGVTLTSLV